MCVCTRVGTDASVEYYSAIKKKELLPFVTAWVDPEGVMPSEVSQTEKDQRQMISLPCAA